MATKIRGKLHRARGLTLPKQDILRLQHAIEGGATLQGLVDKSLQAKYRMQPEPAAFKANWGERGVVAYIRPGVAFALKNNPSHPAGMNVTHRIRAALRNLCHELGESPAEKLTNREIIRRSLQAAEVNFVTPVAEAGNWRTSVPAAWLVSRVRSAAQAVGIKSPS